MEALNIKGTDDTPTIIFDPDNNKFEISGSSMPEDVISFYQPALDWLDKYASEPLDKTIVDFKMEYFNTASSKVLMDILTKLEDIHEAGNEINIRWHYQEDDEDMMDAGEQYSELIEIPFENIEIKEE